MLKKLLFVVSILLLFSGLSLGQNTYLGVENSSASCSNCHSDATAAWENTGHAIAQDSIDNDHYGYSCLGCHNTGWDPTTDNGGADEYVEQDTTQTPDYVITDQEGWDRMKNVQCESCHGPAGNDDGSGLASDHFQGGLAVDYSAENCGECHEGAHHPYLSQWQESLHAESEVSFFSRENNGDCYYCHYAQDFVAFLNDPEYDGTDFEPTGELQPISCATCHTPHGNDNPGDIREVPEGHEGHVICDVCHNAHIEGEVDVESTPHHTTSEALDGADNFGYQYEGEEYSNSFHSNIEDRCVACHVHSTPYDGDIANTGHTFEPRIESCQECHSDYDLEEGNFDYRGTQTMVQNLMDSLKTNLDMANASDSTTDAFKRANYNYLSVKAEGSMGIHNTDLVVGLLEDALAKFSPTTSVEAEEGAMPEKFALSQNYPNPFNPKTNIEFSIPEPTNVRVVVYNTLGKEVTTLVNKQLTSGKYTVSWDGSDYSSGIYLYKLETDKFSQVKKMLLVK